MNKKLTTGIFFIIALFCFKDASAQNDTLKEAPVYHVGIFAPLYLDSVFSSNNNFKYRQAIPRFIMPAVDFVQGAQIALDTMQAGNDKINAAIYDTKSYTQPVPWLIQNKKLDSLDLIIGSVKDAEYLQLAEFALQKNIPFISATYPNDGGISRNPSLVIVNSTLKAHCEAIYSYILQNHGTDKIYLCRQKGVQEDLVASHFKQINEQDGKPLLPIQILNLDNKLDAAVLKARLDSNRHSVIIGGSLTEAFAENLSLACFELHKTYPITLIGMPNWDGFASLQKKNELPDFPIYFTSPYFNNKGDEFSKMITAAYQKKYKGKPTDMTFKGFESVYLFTKLLAMYPNEFMSHINDKNIKVFCDYNFRPVMLKKQNADGGQPSLVPDYFENKHLYFIKILNGGVSRAW
ncbi:MAG TPA: ABC transporter substrate-binding protein [Ferruginibacter sp.]|nr:ABC transporter substrate-binding protein [Ferruginibacter sp.]